MRVVDNLPAHIQKGSNKTHSHTNKWVAVNPLCLKVCEIHIEWLLHYHRMYLACLNIRLPWAIKAQTLIRDYYRRKRKHAKDQQAVN